MSRAKSTNGIWKINGQDIKKHILIGPPLTAQLELLEVEKIEAILTIQEALSFLDGQTRKSMPIRKVQYVQGGYYHVYNRGAGRQPIFCEEKNYLYLLRLLKQVSTECHIALVAYCLLPNHYHWLVRQDGDVSAGKLPARVFGSYSQAFNKAYSRTGTLFEGPYKAIAVTSDEYLYQLCRYIHANPVRNGLVSLPEQWPYSNYREWIADRHGTLVDLTFVQAHFGSPQAYEASIKSYLNEPATFRDTEVTFLEALSFQEGYVEPYVREALIRLNPAIAARPERADCVPSCWPCGATA